MTENDVSGRTAILTGASRGIGEAVATRLAAAGMRLALVARNAERLQQVAASIERDGGAAFPVVCDLADAEQLSRAVAVCREHLGDRIDVLVNNAAVFHEAPVVETEPDDWERVMRTNLTAPFLLCREVLPAMIVQAGGHIVNVASTSGLKGYVEQSAYCASKHGLIGFTRSLALEAKPHGIHVSVIAPGGVNTDFIAGSLVADRIRGQSVIEPADIAELVLFVLRQPRNVWYPEVTVQRFS